jgi:cytochrome bd ubiquinol oxidase subunit II
VIALIFLPLVLLYQGWSLWTFRKRLVTPPSQPPGPEPVQTVPTAPNDMNPNPST